MKCNTHHNPRCCCNTDDLLKQAIEVEVLKTLQYYIKPLEIKIMNQDKIIQELQEDIKLLKETP